MKVQIFDPTLFTDKCPKIEYFKTYTIFHLAFILLFCHANIQAQSLPAYRIGEVPNVIFAKQSKVIKLKITHSIAGKGRPLFSLQSPPNYTHVQKIDSLTGVLYYKNDTEPLPPYPITFRATYSDGEIYEQAVQLVSQPNLPPEATILGIPSGYYTSPFDKSFYHVTESPGAKTSLNNADRATRIIEISGHTLVFDKNSPLWVFSGAEDIEKIILTADSLVIGDMLDLPQTEVEIQVRVIFFRNSGAISTTPRSIAYRANPVGQSDSVGVNGVDGLDGGNIHLHCKKMQQTANKVRLITNAGRGQSAGIGRDGADGASLWGHSIQTHNDTVWTKVYHYEKYCKRKYGRGCSVKYRIYGTRAWPGDGESGVPAGIPGVGGDGGYIYSNIEFSEQIINVHGGQSGEKGTDTKGGLAGTPTQAFWAFKYAARHGSWTYQYHTSKPGHDIAAPPAAKAKGEDGQFVQVSSNAFAWMNALALQKILLYAKDAYINGNPGNAYQILSKYQGIVTQYQKTLAWDKLPGDQQMEFELIDQEIKEIITNLENGLDYFGNYPNYTPYLSFEFYHALFKQEIDRSLNILYLTEILNSQYVSLTKKREVITNLRQELVRAATQNLDEIKKHQLFIPQAGTRLSSLNNQQEAMRATVATFEEKLLKDAEYNQKKKTRISKIKQGAAILGQVLQFVPGANVIGTGLTIASKLDFQKKSLSFDNAKIIYAGIRNHNEKYDRSLVKTLEGSKKILSYMGNINVSNWLDSTSRDTVKKIYKEMKPYASKLPDLGKEIFAGIKKLRQTKPDIQGELDKLKAESPEYIALIGQLKSLMQEFGALDAEITKNFQKIAHQKSALNQNFLALDANNKALAKTTLVLDNRLKVYIDVMQYQAKERLLKYHYLLMRISSWEKAEIAKNKPVFLCC